MLSDSKSASASPLSFWLHCWQIVEGEKSIYKKISQMSREVTAAGADGCRLFWQAVIVEDGQEPNSESLFKTFLDKK